MNKKLKIGIVGTESYHSYEFFEIIKNRSDTVLTAVWGENEESQNAFAEKCGIDCFADTPADMADKIDAVLITLRDGAAHLEAARPFIGKNIAVWVDKPFTVSVKDAKELINLFAQNGTVFSGGTSIKMSPQFKDLKERFITLGSDCLSGYMAYQTILDSPYSGMHFYSHHLIESVLCVFGTSVRSVFAKRSGNGLAAIASYDNFNVLMNYGVKNEPLHAGVFGSESSFMTEYDTSGGLKLLFDEFINAAGTGVSPYSPEFFLTAVKMCNAIEISVKEHREVYLSEVE